MRTLPQQYYRDTEDGFKPDRFRDLAGGISVDPDFVEELGRIDPRLVLRWDPFDPCWKVWIRMADGRLWCRPTWECRQPETGRPWRPQSYDLRKIQETKRRAEADWRKRDADQRALEQRIEQEARRSAKEKSILSAARFAKTHDLTALKLGAVRGVAGGDPVRRGKKKEKPA